MKKKKSQQGIGMFEVVIGLAIVALAITGLIGGFQLFLKASFAGIDDVKAATLLEEGFEAVRYIRDNEGYTTAIAPRIGGGQEYLIFDEAEGVWTATTTPHTIDDIFERTVVFEEVSRDGSDDIVTSGGSADPDTAKMTVTVVWPEGARSVSGYITNLFDE